MPFDFSQDFADIDLFQSILSTPGVCGIDTETTIARAYERTICTIQLHHEDGRSCLLRVWGEPLLLQQALDALEAAVCTLVAHNAIFEIEVFQKLGAEVPCECTMMAAKALKTEMRGDATAGQRWGLAPLMEQEFGIEVAKDEQTRDWTRPLDESAITYAMDDARYALDLWNLYEAEFDKDSWSGYEVIRDALPALAECNLTGLKLDLAAHEDLCERLEDDIAEGLAKLSLIAERGLGGEGIVNHGSPKQVGEWITRNLFENPDHTPDIAAILFHQVTEEFWPTTSLGFSLDKGIIGRILPMVEIVSPIVGEYLLERAQWMKARKMYEAFGPALRLKVDADGRVRASLRPHGAKTTRMSAFDPNIQQMPNAPEFREMFVAGEGRKLCIADYGQMELRAGCLIGNDKAMQQVFAEGGDIHSATACKVFHIPPDQFDPDNNREHNALRKKAKAPNFLVLYGGGVGGLALASGMNTDEAESILSGWLAAYPGIARYRDEGSRAAEAKGYVQLVSGQKLKIVRSTRQPQIVNAPVQGGCASVAYRALRLVRDGLREARLDARICAPIHDEIIVDASDTDADRALEILEWGMLTAMLEYFPEAKDLGMDSLADGAVGDNWAAKP